MTTGAEPKRRRKRKRKAETRVYANQRMMWDTRWTPNDDNFRDLIFYAVTEAGSVLALSRIVGLRNRHLRRILHGDHKAVSFRVADQILARSGVAYKLNELEWLTVEELVERGIWKPQRIFGRSTSK
jgi:hypothetical protein